MKVVRYNLPTDIQPLVTDIHMILDILKENRNKSMIIYQISLNVNPRVLDLINIRYYIKIHSYKYPDI